MDIQIRKQLEQLEYIKDKLEYIEYSESLQCYVEKLNGIPTGVAAWVNGAFYGFEQAAKAQAVSDGFVVVPVELSESIAEKLALEKVEKPRQENDVVWQEIADRTYMDRLLQKKLEIIRNYKELVEAVRGEK